MPLALCLRKAPRSRSYIREVSPTHLSATPDLSKISHHRHYLSLWSNSADYYHVNTTSVVRRSDTVLRLGVQQDQAKLRSCVPRGLP